MAFENTLFYGDCLNVLKEIPDETADLIYLDPPFNSKRDYNAFFTSQDGKISDASIMAFEDTWHWGPQAQREYDELLKNPNGGSLAETIMPALRAFLAQSDMMAYLVMMASRLVELKRVLKNTGSLYLHCDPTASHYLKILLDGVFGAVNFKNEIVWKRRKGTLHTTGEYKKYGSVTDTIFYYTKTGYFTYNQQYSWNSPDYLAYVEKTFNLVDETGRKYCTDNLASPSYRKNLIYEYKGYPPPANGWAISKEKMEEWDREGRLEFPKNPTSRIRRKRFLDELKGEPVQSLWDDIGPISSQSADRLGYPTQKPLELLERIINTSSNPGDVVLDPFCGCGTAVHAAQKLDRKWIGIDITHLAVGLIKRRMHAAFPQAKFKVSGTPQDVDAAKFLAESNGNDGRYQFQYWALSLVDGIASQDKKKGADGGSDGFIWAYNSTTAEKPFKINISVKSGKIPANHIRELGGMLGQGGIEICLLITLEDPSKKMVADALAYGDYEYPNGKKFNRIQILTIKDLLEGKQPHFLDFGEGAAMPKKAKREVKKLDYLSLFQGKSDD